MSIGGVGPSQGGFAGPNAGQQSGGTGDLRKQIEDLKSKLAMQQGQGAGGPEGAGEGLEELLKELMEQLKAQEGQEGQGAGGEGQQPGGGGQQISFGAYQ